MSIPKYRRQKQTVCECSEANCWSTVIACCLNMPADDVPNFCTPEDGWWEKTQEWLAMRGLTLVAIPWEHGSMGAGGLSQGTICIASGKSPHHPTEMHSVMAGYRYEDKKHYLDYIHDPSPSGGFLDGDPTEIDFFVVIDPAKGTTDA